MQNDYTKPEFKKLLQKLQEESWQLELLISGFAIFGLFTAIPTITESLIEAENSRQIYTFVISLVATISCYILIFNLLLHVLFYIVLIFSYYFNPANFCILFICGFFLGLPFKVFSILLIIILALFGSILGIDGIP